MCAPSSWQCHPLPGFDAALLPLPWPPQLPALCCLLCYLVYWSDLLWNQNISRVYAIKLSLNATGRGKKCFLCTYYVLGSVLFANLVTQLRGLLFKLGVLSQDQLRELEWDGEGCLPNSFLVCGFSHLVTGINYCCQLQHRTIFSSLKKNKTTVKQEVRNLGFPVLYLQQGRNWSTQEAPKSQMECQSWNGPSSPRAPVVSWVCHIEPLALGP